MQTYLEKEAAAGPTGVAPQGGHPPAGDSREGGRQAVADEITSSSPPPGPQARAGRPAEAAHPTNGLDDTVHQRHRLGILTVTAEARADFGYLRDALGLTAGNLSRHLTVLEEAGLVQVEKGYEGRRPRTWVKITGKGRSALSAEISALTELVRRHKG